MMVWCLPGLEPFLDALKDGFAKKDAVITIVPELERKTIYEKDFDDYHHDGIHGDVYCCQGFRHL